MRKPAARIGDLHTCPMTTGPVPHVGGAIVGPCVLNVNIGGQPAAVVGDMATCTGPVDSITQGSGTVHIGGRPAARMGDLTAHGGAIALGFPTVNIGDAGGGSAQAAAMVAAARNGTPFIEECPCCNHDNGA